MKSIKYKLPKQAVNYACEYVTKYVSRIPAKERPLLDTPEKTVNYLFDNKIYTPETCVDVEYVTILAMRGYRLIGHQIVNTGTDVVCLIDTKKIMTFLLHVRAQGFAIIHNHPSGRLVASQQDIELTKKFLKAGMLLDIGMHDSFIVTEDRSYYSFAEKGMLRI